MGWVDTAKDLADRVARLFERVTTLEAKTESHEKTLDRIQDSQRDFIDRQREDIRALQQDFDEIRRRLSRVEGTLDSVFERSLKEALVQLGREHLKEHGSLEDFEARLLGGRGRSDEEERAS